MQLQSQIVIVIVLLISAFCERVHEPESEWIEGAETTQAWQALKWRTRIVLHNPFVDHVLRNTTDCIFLGEGEAVSTSTIAMADILAEIQKIPPVTRFLVVSSVGVTLSAALNIVSPYSLIYINQLVTKRWQVNGVCSWCGRSAAHSFLLSYGDCTRLSFLGVSPALFYLELSMFNSIHIGMRLDYVFELAML